MARIAIGGFQHETNTFAPVNATFDDFARADGWPPLLMDAGLESAVAGMNLPIAGFIKAARDLGHQLIPLVWCSATPSGPVTESAFERIAEMLQSGLAAASNVDAVYLDLHGAMVTTVHADGEGELLRRIRTVLPRDLPVVASLDLHANITPAMVERATALVAYRTYPHVDMSDTGRRAAALLDRILARGRPPARAFRQLDYLIPIVSQCTLSEPAEGLYRVLEKLQGGAVHSVDLALGFPAADVADCGPSVVAYGSDDGAVRQAADALSDAICAAEPAFRLDVCSPDEGVARAIAHAGEAARGPVILADTQDNPGGGAESDGVTILKTLLRHRAQGAAVGILYDPEAARAAHAAGRGAEINLSVGARSGYGDETPLAAPFRVEALGEGRFSCSGPYYKGCRMDLGPMARLRTGGIDIIVASRKQQAADQAMFRHVGVDPAAQRILALKSSVHFRADFGPIAREILVIAAPGPNLVDPAQHRFRRLRKGVRLRPLGPAFAGAAD